MKDFREYRDKLKACIDAVLNNSGDSKRKVAIVTWCNNNGPTNYGQILQCYAMQMLFKTFGFEVTTVLYKDTSPRGCEDDGDRVIRFQEFINDNIELTKLCLTETMIEKEVRDYNLLVCGSDQLWNPIFYDPVFLLGFGDKEQKRIAISVSGVFLDDESCRDKYVQMAPLLEKLDYISLRERCGKEIISKYTSKEVDVVPDPTLLVEKQVWENVAICDYDAPFVFCYIIGGMESYIEGIRRLAKEYNATKVLYISSNIVGGQDYSDFTMIKGCGPAEFVGFIKKAKLVITDSFHGVCFANIFETPCYCVDRVQKGGEIFGGRARINNLETEYQIDIKWLYSDVIDNSENSKEYINTEKTRRTCEVVLSVVMPVYNGEKYLENTIKDIRAQSYDNYELIIVNDGSTDSTEAILKELSEKDSHIKYISTEHGSAGTARNAGMKLAKGQYIMFLDSDDRFDSELFELTVQEADKYNTDILMFDAAYEDNRTGVEISSDHVIRKDRLPNKEVFSHADCPEWFLNISFNVIWTKLYKRSFLEEHKLCFENLRYCEDVVFHHLALLEAKRIHYLDKKLVRYQHNRPGNSSNIFNYSEYPTIAYDVTQKVKKYIIDNCMDERLLLGLLENELFRMNGIMVVVDEEHFDEMYETFRGELLTEQRIDDLCNQDWADKELTEWANNIVGLDKYAYINYMYYCYRDKYWFWSFLFEKVCQEKNLACKELETLIHNKHWLYDEDVLREGDTVIVHGAGEVGKDYVNQIRREGKVKLVGWTDKNYQKLDTKMGVESPQIIRDRSFDKLIIAIRDLKIAKKIRDDFAGFVPSEKILLMSDMQKGLENE